MIWIGGSRIKRSTSCIFSIALKEYTLHNITKGNLIIIYEAYFSRYYNLYFHKEITVPSAGERLKQM